MKAPVSPAAILRDGADAPPQDEGCGCGAPSLRGAKRRSNPAFFAAAKLDCFASLAMTWKHASSLPRRDSARACKLVVPLGRRGRGEAGRQRHSQPRVQMKKHTS